MFTKRVLADIKLPLLGLIAGYMLASHSSGHCSTPETDQWRDKMAAIVPQGYLCRHTSTPVAMDGKLEAGAWAAAPWTADFVDIQGDVRPKPRFRTRAKLLWDDEYLYVAAELQEPHIWATLTNHDAVIFQDPDFEVFFDPDGDTHAYHEFEMNALNTGWDLMLNQPYLDNGKPNDAWSIPGLKTAVHINGTLNQPADTDQGWTVEIAFPWRVLSEHARHPGPPTEGEQWRVDFSRVEWQITTNGGDYQKVPNTPEDNWVWSPQGVVDMHRPEMWGRVQFTREPAGVAVPLTPIPGKPARDLALEIYHAQRDFKSAHQRWATNLTELGWKSSALPPGVEPPVLDATPDGYFVVVAFQDGQQRRTWRIRHDRLLRLDEPLPLETETFVQAAAERFGATGRRAAYFLVDNMPVGDRSALGSDFLLENLELALRVRTNFPWAAVPERIFLNDVLPYAALDEPRDPWRAEFYRLASEIVRDCKTATEAAQSLNRDLFKQINVHYNLGRKRTNQSPKESMAQGKATCTGLAIILVDACRAIGVPARIAGVPEWAHKNGNHTWVEIWDGDWFFTGADEYDKNGLNRAWFNADAATTVRSTNALNQIYATSWRRTDQHFPLPWDLASREVPAVIVSARYMAPASAPNTNGTNVHVRLLEKAGGERLPADVELQTASGQRLAQNHTRAGTADLNDMPDFTLPENAAIVVFRFVRNGEAREKAVRCASCANSHTLDFVWSELTPVPPNILRTEAWLARPAADRGTPPELNLTRAEAERVAQMLWANARRTRSESAKEELSAKRIVIGARTLKWMEKTFGDSPDGKHSLWITLHGGGQATTAENDANWKGYYGRYEFPPGSINVAPRAPADSWDMWSIKEVDELIDRLIADMVLERGVDVDRVYLIGYSAGGDGVYQVAPRMADRFAAAGMCAGHPNQVTPEGLRNLPFFLYMGGEDAAYHRNTVVREFSAKLDALQAADPAGYTHRLTVYPGLQHNMQNREAEMIAHMTPLARDAWPKRVVWNHNDPAAHTRYYWLERTPQAGEPKSIYAARVEGQTISLEAPAHGNLTLRLSDALLDLDRPVRVLAGGRTVYEGTVSRSLASVAQSLREREDPATIATARLSVSW